MTTSTVNSKHITTLLNGTIQSVTKTIPFDIQIGKPSTGTDELHSQFGVLIGITGDVKGQIFFSGKREAFNTVGQAMFGMELEGEMFKSFCGELGNMIAGGLATIISNQGVTIDITSPTLMEGDMKLTGYKRSLKVPLSFKPSNELSIYLLLDS